TVVPYLERQGIFSRGRFGMWKYEVSNTDHSLMQGVELINRLLRGEQEQTIGIRYESTLDGRNAATHERSRFAGSGDPKRIETRIEPMMKKKSWFGSGGVGDKKNEPHISEEELGVT